MIEEFFIPQLQWRTRSTALEWLGEYGGQRGFLALYEDHVNSFPLCILTRDSRASNNTANCGPAALNRLSVKAGTFIDDFDWLNAVHNISERLGKEELTGMTHRVICGIEGSNRLQLLCARSLLASKSDLQDRPNDAKVATRLVKAFLKNADPIIRAGAAYGLAESGNVDAEAIASLETAISDPDDVVREAAEYALQKIQGER